MKTIRKITKYPALPEAPIQFRKYRNVAVYARVSTSSDEQLNSIEAPKDYYISYIATRSDWKLYSMYADAGISGTSKKRRDSFNRMLEDAEAGYFDLIITKAISRFARNTVDSLVCIRRLKEIGVEVYFEKEDLWTFDSKGEFMLTLLSSMAQEESRSISENVAWGHRKRFADGKYSVPYKQFLGYDCGSEVSMVINPTQALTVRLIFKLYLEGKTAFAVTQILHDAGIPSPSGKDKWSQTTVLSILTNEKYKGDALLQKRYTADFLTKKSVKNHGELPKYYVTNGHEAIIPRAVFDYTQELIERRHHEYGRRFSCTNPLSAKIQCEDCGSFYGLKSAHSGSQRGFYWVCNSRYRNAQPCRSPRIREERMNKLCRVVMVYLIISRKWVISDCVALLESSIQLCDPFGKTSERLRIIENCMSMLISESPHIISITNEALAIIVDRITATTDNKMVFNFINGESLDIQI